MAKIVQMALLDHYNDGKLSRPVSIIELFGINDWEGNRMANITLLSNGALHPS